MTSTSINKVYLKFHARLIVAIVALTGFASSHLMLKYSHLEIWQRYTLAAVASYVAFVALMYFWKQYLEGLPPIHAKENKNATPIARSEKSWKDYLDVPDFTSGIEELAIALVVLVLFILLIYFAVYIVYELPILMIEVVLTSTLSTLFYNPIKKADNDIFIFKVLRNTYKQGAVLILIYLTIGLTIQSTCPLAIKLADLFNGTCR